MCQLTTLCVITLIRIYQSDDLRMWNSCIITNMHKWDCYEKCPYQRLLPHRRAIDGARDSYSQKDAKRKKKNSRWKEGKTHGSSKTVWYETFYIEKLISFNWLYNSRTVLVNFQLNHHMVHLGDPLHIHMSIRHGRNQNKLLLKL